MAYEKSSGKSGNSVSLHDLSLIAHQSGLGSMDPVNLHDILLTNHCSQEKRICS